MKKALTTVLAVITVTALLFTTGFFLWRNRDRQAPLFQTHDAISPALSDSNRININTADLDTLTTLPGIGKTLAQRILDYRAEHGPFESVSALLQVPGLGEGKLEAILDLITIGGTT